MLLALTVLAGWQLPRLQIHVSADGLMAEHDPDRAFYEQARNTFGATESLAIVVRDPELFAPPVLARLQPLIRQLEALPYVAGTDSLFTVKQARNQNDEISFAPYLDPLPATLAEGLKVHQAAYAHPFIAGNLLSADARTMAINVRLKPQARGPEEDRQIVAGIDAVIAPLRGQVAEVFALGMPQVNTGLSDLILDDQKTLLPLSMGVLLVVLMLTLGHPASALLPLFTGALSIIWTLGLLALTGTAVNVMTSIVPALLMVVGATQDVHMITAYLAARREGAAPARALHAMAAGTGLAMLLAFVTTYIGFLTIAVNDIRLLREFGLVASTGLLFNFVITLLAVPALLSLAGRGEAPARPPAPGLYERLGGAVSALAARRPLAIVLAGVLIGVVSAAGAGRLQVDNDTMANFPGTSPIRQQAQILHEQLAGLQSFDIILDGRVEGTFLKPRYLKALRALQDFLGRTGQVDKTQSLADYVAETNRVMEGLPPGRLELPEEEAAVASFIYFADRENLKPWVDQEFTRARISVRHHLSGSADLQRLIRAIEEHARAQLDPALDMRITGESILAKRAADSMAEGQAQSLLLMITIIFLIISGLFLSLRAGLLAIAPNLLPILVLFGVMGFAGVPLNTGTAMVAAIAIGICVDDTIHFLVVYNQQMRDQPTADAGIRATLLHETRPMLSTSVALAAGFAVLAASSFPPVRDFGLLSTLVMLAAVAANLLLLPVLLRLVRLVTVWDVLGVRVRTQLLGQSELFRGIRPWEARKLIAMSNPKTYAPGEAIIRRGDQGQEMFVLLSGRVAVTTGGSDPGKGIELAAGQLFGEVALVAETTRTADITAVEESQVLALRLSDLRRLGRYLPRTAAKLYLNMARILARRQALPAGAAAAPAGTPPGG